MDPLTIGSWGLLKIGSEIGHAGTKLDPELDPGLDPRLDPKSGEIGSAHRNPISWGRQPSWPAWLGPPGLASWPALAGTPCRIGCLPLLVDLATWPGDLAGQLYPAGHHAWPHKPGSNAAAHKRKALRLCRRVHIQGRPNPRLKGLVRVDRGSLLAAHRHAATVS